MLILTFVELTLKFPLVALGAGSCPGARGPGVGGESDNIVSYFVNLRLGGGAGLHNISPHH